MILIHHMNRSFVLSVSFVFPKQRCYEMPQKANGIHQHMTHTCAFLVQYITLVCNELSLQLFQTS